MIKDQVWWPSNQCCSQTTNPKHWFKTTIPNFIVISEELAKNSPEITRLPKMGPAHSDTMLTIEPMETKLTDELIKREKYYCGQRSTSLKTKQNLSV